MSYGLVVGARAPMQVADRRLQPQLTHFSTFRRVRASQRAGPFVLGCAQWKHAPNSSGGAARWPRARRDSTPTRSTPWRGSSADLELLERPERGSAGGPRTNYRAPSNRWRRPTLARIDADLRWLESSGCRAAGLHARRLSRVAAALAGRARGAVRARRRRRARANRSSRWSAAAIPPPADAPPRASSPMSFARIGPRHHQRAGARHRRRQPRRRARGRRRHRRRAAAAGSIASIRTEHRGAGRAHSPLGRA